MSTVIARNAKNNFFETFCEGDLCFFFDLKSN